MPAIEFDATTVPKRPRLVYISVPSLPSRELAELIHVLYDPDLKRPAKDEDSEPEQVPWPRGAPDKPTATTGPIEVIAVSPMCSTAAGRNQTLLALRSAGLPGPIAHQLGWATSVPKDAVELDASAISVPKKAPKASKRRASKPRAADDAAVPTSEGAPPSDG